MLRFPEKRVAITGAASGLGLALAKHFLSHGWHVAFADIQDDTGQQVVAALALPQEKAFYQHVDVTNPSDLQSWHSRIEMLWGGLDILINNAGVAAHGTVDEAPLEDWDWVININLMGVVRGCKEFIPVFKRQRSGHIINVASMAGLVHSPELASYNASKAAVVAISETLLGELDSYGVSVSVVCPGFFPTGLTSSARVSHPQMKQVIERLFATSRLSADDIARIVYNKVESGKFYILPHFSYRPGWWLRRFLPLAYLRSMKSIGKQLLGRRSKWQDEAEESGPSAHPLASQAIDNLDGDRKRMAERISK
jgi:NAD(P)-dependent dehydrogenase (short-subunit alcohol dehydrogenase family)